jgi:tRNA nucleotidyltransferase (CCA-adding enzyme)
VGNRETLLQIYQVGGSVRDEMLGLPVTDRDWVVVGATAQEMQDLGYRLVGKDFPVFLHPQTHEEYALARTERKVGPGYKGFTVYAAPDVTLDDDLRRRDLTVNAMALAPDGSLIDPFGGAADLKQRLLRHVSPAFSEDPVRILRVARFAARFAPLGFAVADDTLALMRAMVEAGEADALVAERVWTELVRALGEQRPSRFFEVLRDCGALRRLFPELDKLFGVPQAPQHHPEIDTGVHVLQVVDRAAQLSPDTRVRFAALLHDLGKGATPPEQWPRHIGHEERGLALIEAFCQRLRAPNDYRELALLTAKYHGVMLRAEELRPATLLDTLQALDAFRRPARFEQFLLACEADFTGRPGYEQRPYTQAALLRSMLQVAQSIDAAALAAQGLKGEALAEELRQQRIAAIRAARGMQESGPDETE